MSPQVKRFILVAMKLPAASPRRKTGRPLSFDPEAALAPAMLLFWRQGYEGTSLAELTKAMGVTSPSVYAAYGDKKGLFRAAVRRYLAQPLTPVEVVAQAPSAREAARSLVEGAVLAYTGADTPAGCLLASSAIAVSPQSDDVRLELAAIRREIEAALRDRIAAEAGELPDGFDPAGLAAFVMAVIQGFSTLARDGASRETLQRAARIALAAWTTEAT